MVFLKNTFWLSHFLNKIQSWEQSFPINSLLLENEMKQIDGKWNLQFHGNRFENETKNII